MTSTVEAALGRGGATREEALAIYDGLGTVEPAEMIGTWRGEGFPTGHWMDGLLEATGWYGKQFLDAETVHPLLFHTADRSAAFPVDPARLPMGVRVPTTWSYHRLVLAARPVLGTRRPAARLRRTEYRGRTTATMVYDARPINDVFRRVSADTVLGAMDHRGDDHPFFFVLHRDPGKVVRA